MDPAGEYSDFVAEYYDHVVPYRTRPDIGFYVEMGQKTGGPVLELGCGTGRVLIPMARAGLEIMGLDISPAMLSVCVEQLAREPEELRSRVHLIQGDMRSFDLGRLFALVTIPFRAFQHLLAPEEQLDCLRCIHRHLSASGLLILDLFNPSMERLGSGQLPEEFCTEPEFEMPGGRKVVRRHRQLERDLHHQVIAAELVYEVTHADGHSESLVQRFPLRYFFRYEAEHLLARAGFAVETVYADFEKRPYGSSYPGDMIFVARKS